MIYLVGSRLSMYLDDNKTKCILTKKVVRKIEKNGHDGISIKQHSSMPAGNYMFKVNDRNFRTRCEIYSKLTVKTPERCLASSWCLYC